MAVIHRLPWHCAVGLQELDSGIFCSELPRNLVPIHVNNQNFVANDWKCAHFLVIPLNKSDCVFNICPLNSIAMQRQDSDSLDCAHRHLMQCINEGLSQLNLARTLGEAGMAHKIIKEKTLR